MRCALKTLKCPPYIFFFMMTLEIAIGMLRVARNGEQMLEILDTLMNDVNESDDVETAPIEF